MSIFSSKPKFALPTTEKCGEISFSNIAKRLHLHCVFCGSDFVMLNYFLKHIEKNHLNKHILLEGDNPLKYVAKKIPSKNEREELPNLLKPEGINEDLQKDPLNIEESIQKDELYSAYNQPEDIKTEKNIDVAFLYSTAVEDITEMQEQITQFSDESSMNIKTETSLEESQIVEEFMESCDEQIEFLEELEDSDEEFLNTNKTLTNRLKSKEIVLELIEQIKNHTIIWNKSHQHFHNITERAKTYNIITSRLKTIFPNEDICNLSVKQRVNSLLSKFRKSLKNANLPFAKSQYFERMTFLQEYYLEPKEITRSRYKPNAAGLYECALCSKELRSESILYYHMLRHNKQYKIKCDLCSKPFYTQSEVRRHMKSHTQERLLVCETCGKTFGLPYQLKMHRKRHTNQRDYKCTVCPKAFYGSDKLKAHLKTHDKKYTEKCEVCGKLFITTANLKQHLKIHNPVKGYHCKVCGKAFSQTSQRSVHMRVHKI